jgi:5-methylcytosine-specific restriction protein A
MSPRRPKSTCRHPNCPELADVGEYCASHRKVREKDDREHRGTSSQRGYDKRHRKWRNAVLARDPLCVECLKRGQIVPSKIADHIAPLDPNDPASGDWSLENGQGLCITHHNQKTALEQRP